MKAFQSLQKILLEEKKKTDREREKIEKGAAVQTWSVVIQLKKD